MFTLHHWLCLATAIFLEKSPDFKVPVVQNWLFNMAADSKLNNGINKLAVVLAALVLYNLLLTAFVGYAAYYAINRFESLSQADRDLQKEVNHWKMVSKQV